MSKFKYIVNTAKFQDLRPLIYKKGFKVTEFHTCYTSFTITEFKNNSNVIKAEVNEQNDVVI